MILYGGKSSEPHARDTNNEQVTPLLAGAVFEGAYTRIDRVDHFEILYAATTPFTAQKIWSNDGISPLGGSFGVSTIAQQTISGYNVAYDVNEGRNLAPYYKLKITNGVTDQTAFPGFISITWLMKTPYQGAFGVLDSALNNLSRALLTRAVVAGVRPDGTFANSPTDGVDPNNSSTAILGAAGVFTGAGSILTGHKSISVHVFSDVSGTLALQVATAAGTYRTVASRNYTGGSPQGYVFSPIASRYRLVFTNGATPQTAFELEACLYSGAVGPIFSRLDTPLVDGALAAQTRAIITGKQPDGDYDNVRVSGSDPGNTTTALLGSGATFTGTQFDATGFTSVQLTVKASHASAIDGVKIQFSNDGFATVNREQIFTYGATDAGFGRTYSVSATQGEEYRIQYVNGATAQTAFDLRTELSTETVQSQNAPIETPISGASSAEMTRAVIVGKKDDGTTAYSNVGVHTDATGTSLLTAQGHRISQVLGRTHQEVVSLLRSTSGALFTVPAGKNFYAHSVQVFCVNTSTTTFARGVLRDGGAGGEAKFACGANANSVGVGAVAPTQNISASFDEPLLFGTDVFFELTSPVTGATFDIKLVGYLENE